jgi:UPF0716 protein FxsA
LLFYLILAFTLIPIIEVMLLVKIAEHINWGPTIGIVLLTGVLGAWLARREGFKIIRKISNDMAAGIPPTTALVDGLLILVAGVVLVTPGVLTDLCGFCLLVPPLRRWVRRRLAEAFKKRMVIIHSGGREPFNDDPFIDVPGTGHDADEPTHDDHRLDR